MSSATLPQAMRVLELITQKKVSSESLQRLLESGCLADLLKASDGLDRDEFRQFLELRNVYPDTITELTGIVIPEDVTILKASRIGGASTAINQTTLSCTSLNSTSRMRGSRLRHKALAICSWLTSTRRCPVNK